MAKIRHERISNESKRNLTFSKRIDGLIKKSNELSILCGVEIAIVVHKQGGEDNSILWPSPPVFQEMMQKFFNFPDFERNRKMVLHEKYMEQRANEEIESISKSKKKIEFQESQQLMNELTQDRYFHQLGLHELNGLNSIADEMLRKLETSYNELNDEEQQVEPLDDEGNDQWLIDAMSEEQDFNSFLEAPPSDTGGAASSAGGDAVRPLGGAMNTPLPPNNDFAP